MSANGIWLRLCREGLFVAFVVTKIVSGKPVCMDWSLAAGYKGWGCCSITHGESTAVNLRDALAWYAKVQPLLTH
jgi:hypothetical protein